MKCPKCQTENPSSRSSAPNTQLLFLLLKNFQTETLQTPIKELAMGSVFAGRYEVIEELGHGGMGRVFRVFDAKIKEKSP